MSHDESAVSMWRVVARAAAAGFGSGALLGLVYGFLNPPTMFFARSFTMLLGAIEGSVLGAIAGALIGIVLAAISRRPSRPRTPP
jgi:ABC-type branched-subunit amino acid transport system permease subunit